MDICACVGIIIIIKNTFYSQNFIPPPKNRAVREIMRENMVDPVRPLMTK